METYKNASGSIITSNRDEVARDAEKQRLRRELASLDNVSPSSSALESARKVAETAAEDKEIAAIVAPAVAILDDFDKRVSGGVEAAQDRYDNWYNHNAHEDEGFRRARADEKFSEDARADYESAKMVAAAVQETAEALREESVPTHKLDAGEEQLVRDEIRMLFEGTNPQALPAAMLRLLDELAADDPILAVLAGRFGRSYAASRGNAEAHEAFREMLIARAAEHGTGSNRAAARALQAMETTGLVAWAEPAASRGLVGTIYAGLPRHLRDLASN